jgi:hypothetical protein
MCININYSSRWIGGKEEPRFICVDRPTLWVGHYTKVQFQIVVLYIHKVIWVINVITQLTSADLQTHTYIKLSLAYKYINTNTYSSLYHLTRYFYGVPLMVRKLIYLNQTTNAAILDMDTRGYMRPGPQWLNEVHIGRARVRHATYRNM